MKKLLIAIIFLSICDIKSQTIQTTNKKELRTISGIVYDNSQRLKEVTISVLGTNRGTISNKNGEFTINVAINEILLFSHLGYKPLKVIIEESTKNLQVKLREKSNALEEVTIQTKVHTIKPKTIVRMGRGFIHLRSSSYIKGSELNQSASSLISALRGKFPGIKVRRNSNGEEVVMFRNNTYAIWDVDGMVLSSPPPIDISQVKSVAVLKSLAETVLYGSEGAGGVIIIETLTNDPLDPLNNVNSKNNPYTNKNYYNKDATPYNEVKKAIPDYIKALFPIEKVESAFIEYKTLKTNNVLKPNFHINMANYFNTRYKSNYYATLILKDYEKIGLKNKEILRSIAYKYQELNLHKEALEVYKNLMRLHPEQAQSYRDLANAYIHLKQYKNAWKIYKYYLKQGHVLESNPIGYTMAFEMKALLNLRGKEAKIKDRLNFTNLDVDKTSDVRMVFEWNTTDAEFSFEFVNQNQQSYIIDHTLYESNDLIIDEKLKGYNSNQYIINPLTDGTWMININYYGNKKRRPTFLKVTTFYNWGRKNQTEKINVFELTTSNLKLKLLEINSDNLK